MSAEILRAAAKLMRERADACPPRAQVGTITWTAQTDQRVVAPGQHYTAWNPAVALAVAAWLEAEAESHIHTTTGVAVNAYDPPGMDSSPALAVARAYLGPAS